MKQNGAKPFVTDTNTLYFGHRHNSVDHLQTAIQHGFNYAVLDAPVIIADGILGNNEQKIEINQKHFGEVKIAGDIEKSDSMIVMSHFKGHGMSAFGGAIKNLAMGCASAFGKIEQHGCAKPVVKDGCTACGKCMSVCPEDAIYIEDGKSFIDYDRCIGCNFCIEVCPDSVISLDFKKIPEFIEKMVEYAYGAVKNKQDKVCYINFLMNITPDCDCVPWSDAPIVPDIGILASYDPVAIDAASIDLVNKQCGFENSLLHHNFHKGEDKFKGVYEDIDGKIQIKYGEEIGLGSAEYELIRI